ncbi:MAG: dTMP kinase [bacterium]
MLKKNRGQKIKKGKIIVLDGPDGSGKSTVMEAIKEVYNKSAWFSREPGGTPYAEELRVIFKSELAKGADALTQFLNIWSSRADHIARGVKPQVESGKHVFMDRGDSSTWSYQIFGQEGYELQKLFIDVRKMVFGENEPDLYIIFNLDAATAMERKKAQVGERRDHFEVRELDFHQRTMDGYLDFVKKLKVPHVIIDASKSIEHVKEQCLRAIYKVLK